MLTMAAMIVALVALGLYPQPIFDTTQSSVLGLVEWSAQGVPQ